MNGCLKRLFDNKRKKSDYSRSFYSSRKLSLMYRTKSGFSFWHYLVLGIQKTFQDESILIVHSLYIRRAKMALLFDIFRMVSHLDLFHRLDIRLFQVPP